jgi:hypothetical protein
MFPSDHASQVLVFATAYDPPLLGTTAGALVRRILGWAPMLLLGLAALGFVIGPRRGPFCSFETKVDAARLTVHEYADAAYPAWRAEHPGRTCPLLLADLGRYMDKPEGWDPWGRGNGDRVVVVSAGEDRQPGTADDIRSDR